jgi:phage-related baseplate assembly protein
MALTFAQLTQVVTKDEALQTLIDQATALGFNTTSWQSGSTPRTMLEVFVYVYAAASVVVSGIASGGLNSTAEGDWLSLLASSHYKNTRRAAVTTQGTMVLACSALAGPYTITAGQLVVADTATGQTFRNQAAGGSLTSGGTLSLVFEAETAGAAGDIATGATLELKTPLAGVTVTNPVGGSVDSWISRNGADAETDAQLRERNETKWATLGVGPGMAYAHHALTASASVKRVSVDDSNPRGPGTIDLYIAGDSGALAGTIVTAVDDYLDGTTDGVDRVNSSADLLVQSATALSVPVTASVYVIKQYNTAATQTAVSTAISNYFKALPIGGTTLTAGGQGAVRIGGLYSAILAITGVQNVVFAAPTADVNVDIDEVAVPTITLSYYPV